MAEPLQDRSTRGSTGRLSKIAGLAVSVAAADYFAGLTTIVPTIDLSSLQ